MPIRRLAGAGLLFALLTVTPVPGGSKGNPTAAVSKTDRVLLHIRVDEPRGAGAWTVTYTLPAGAAGLQFERPVARRRADRFSVRPAIDGAAARWAVCGDDELLLLDHPADEGRQLTLAVPSETGWSDDYDLNYPFTDGSVLLYEGVLAARPVTCPKEGCCPAVALPGFDPPTGSRWTFRTEPNRGILLLDRAARGRLDWQLPPGLLPEDGTFVYLGDIGPIPDKRMTLILDPGLPSWVAADLRDLVSHLFEQYTRRMQVEIDFRPLIAASYEPSARSGTCSKGGGPEGVLQLALGCSGWRQPDDHLKRSLHSFLAHEMFHLWNGEYFRRQFVTLDQWISEGGSNYMAYLWLRDERLSSQEEFERSLVKAANRCLVELDGEPALGDPPGGNEVFYDCGSVLHFVADHAIRAAAGGTQGIDQLFVGLFQKALRTDRTYSTYDWLEVLQELTGSTSAVADIEHVLHQGVPDKADRFFQVLLERAGLEVERVAVEEAEVGHLSVGDRPHPSFRKLLRLKSQHTADTTTKVHACQANWCCKAYPLIPPRPLM
jgi:hypothetical protein